MQGFSELSTASATRRVSVSAAAIWQVLSDLGGLPAWAPGIDAARILPGAKTGVGAVRQVMTAQFGEIEHRITVWDVERRLEYATADSGPFSRTLTTYDIAHPDKASTEVSVAIAFALKDGDMDASQAKAILTKGLEATLRALELHARMAEPGPDGAN